MTQDDEEQEYHGPCAVCREGIWGEDYKMLDWGGRAHEECDE